MKGLAAAVLESLEAAAACGAEEWLREEIVAVLGEPLLDRLVSGTLQHAERRSREMEDAAAHLRDLGVDPHVAPAVGRLLKEIASDGARTDLPASITRERRERMRGNSATQRVRAERRGGS